MPKQCDGYNMKIAFLKHMMSLSIKTQPSVLVFKYPHRNYKVKVLCSYFCDKGNADHLYRMGVFIQGNQITS